MSLQVGDGMIAAVNIDNKLMMLGKTDSGNLQARLYLSTTLRSGMTGEKRRRVFTTIQGYPKRVC